MIDLYAWKTPNGRKPAILLEELALDYEVHPIDIGKDEQFAPSFLKISPNNKIPAIVDREADVSVFESGAILIYLAEKVGSDLLPSSGEARAKVMEWLMFQMASIGPMFGQFYHFKAAAPEVIPYAVKRYADESKRILGVIERRLADADYLAGAYSIADIAAYPWVAIMPARFDEIGVADDEMVNLKAWLARLAERPAVVKGMKILD